MNEYIYFANRVVSVADPYIYDNFVKGHHRKISLDDVPSFIGAYREISIGNRLLCGLLKSIMEVNKGSAIEVVDVGVFMGTFTVGVDLCSKSVNVLTRINSYEANPLLISSIIKNFRIYNVSANLHWSAIGAKIGSQEFVVKDGGAIGGSLANINNRKVGDYFSCNVDVRPLSDILLDQEDVGIVKIDIEGYEVPAFSSVIGNKNKLNNVFIVEYAPSQANQTVAKSQSYKEFLFDNFKVFNIGNWAWFTCASEIMDVDSLVNCDLGNGGHNTDLLLIPKSLTIDPAVF